MQQLSAELKDHQRISSIQQGMTRLGNWSENAYFFFDYVLYRNSGKCFLIDFALDDSLLDVQIVAPYPAKKPRLLTLGLSLDGRCFVHLNKQYGSKNRTWRWR